MNPRTFASGLGTLAPIPQFLRISQVLSNIFATTVKDQYLLLEIGSTNDLDILHADEDSTESTNMQAAIAAGSFALAGTFGATQAEGRSSSFKTWTAGFETSATSNQQSAGPVAIYKDGVSGEKKVYTVWQFVEAYHDAVLAEGGDFGIIEINQNDGTVKLYQGDGDDNISDLLSTIASTPSAMDGSATMQIAVADQPQNFE